MRAGVIIVAGALAIAGLGGCDDHVYREIGADIRVVTTRSDALVPPAIDRLAGHGRRAIPQIEIALHTAPDAGRRHLFTALARIGDGEAIAILRHFAVYDLAPDVRALCEEILQSWRTGAHGAAAATALARVAELRAKGEGPAPPRP